MVTNAAQPAHSPELSVILSDCDVKKRKRDDLDDDDNSLGASTPLSSLTTLDSDSEDVPDELENGETEDYEIVGAKRVKLFRDADVPAASSSSVSMAPSLTHSNREQEHVRDSITLRTDPSPAPSSSRRHVSNGNESEAADEPSFCHQCRRKSTLPKMCCAATKPNGSPCTYRYCDHCLATRYPLIKFTANAPFDRCPKCSDICNCSVCSRKRGEEYVGARSQAKNGLLSRSLSSRTQRSPATDSEVTFTSSGRPVRRGTKVTAPVQDVVLSSRSNNSRSEPTVTPASALPGIRTSGPVVGVMWSSCAFWGTLYSVDGREKLGTAWVVKEDVSQL